LSGGFDLLKHQLIGVIAVGAFTFLVSYIVWVIMKFAGGIRVSPAEETAGLDISEHGQSAYPDFATSTITTFRGGGSQG